MLKPPFGSLGLMQGPVGTWTERAAAAVQLQDIALGFRLQLHAPHEFRMLYW